MRVIFFGSTSDSVIVLSKIFDLKIKNYKLQIVSVVTQPPRPAGRNQILTPTPVEHWAKEHAVPVLSFPTNKEKPWLYENEQTVIDTIQPLKPDLIVSACYGQKIPWETIGSARFGGLNVHPSILPRWRGGDPVPWAILTGDHQIGVTVVTLAEKFDAGSIIARKKIPMPKDAFPDALRTQLFTIGADVLMDALPDYLSGKTKGVPQNIADQPYARRLTRNDGFEPWEKILAATQHGSDADRIEQKCRAFSPWPGLWTTFEGKRLKVHSCHVSSSSRLVLDEVQWEGKKPVPYKQFESAYIIPS